MLQIRNLDKRYGTRQVLDDVSFDVHPGRMTGFVGGNGAGKTTTMRIILGVLAAGDALLAPEVTRRVIERFGGAAAPRSAELDALTDREAEVFRLLARGFSNAEIATELHVGEATVKTHVSNILLKLGVRDRVQAVVRAYETGFVTPAG